MIALSGVRSSWLTVARKRAFEFVRLFGVAAGALELLRSALVVGDVAGHRDDGVRARCARLGVDAVGAGLDPDHPARVPVLAPLGGFEMEPEFERDRPISEGCVADRLEESRAVGDVHAVEEPAPDEAGRGDAEELRRGGARLDDMAVAIVPGDEIVDRLQERAVAGIAQACGRPAVHLDPAMLDGERRGVRDRRDGEDRHRHRRRPRLDGGPDAGGFESRQEQRRKPGDGARRERRAARPREQRFERHRHEPHRRPRRHAAGGGGDADDEAGERCRRDRMRERQASAARQHDRRRDRRDEADHRHVFGPGRNAADEKVERQKAERDRADGHPARDEALVARALDRVVLGAIVHEPGQARFDRRDGLADTQTQLRRLTRAPLASPPFTLPQGA